MLRHFVVFLLCVLSVSASLSSCPSIKATADKSKIFASWSDYKPSEIVSFEWAVVEGSLSTEDNVCSSKPLFYTLPNVMKWTHVRKSNQVDSQSLTIDQNKEYRVILRITTQDGSLVWVSSSPVEHVQSLRSEKPSSKQQQGERFIPLNLPDCELDQNNNCRAATISTREKLDVLYGAPQWPNRVGANSIYRE